MLGDDDDDGEGEEASIASFMGLLIVEITCPSSSIVLLCSVTIVVDSPSGYPPSAGTTCVPMVRAYSRTEMVPKDIDLDGDNDDGLVDVDCVDVDITVSIVSF